MHVGMCAGGLAGDFGEAWVTSHPVIGAWRPARVRIIGPKLSSLQQI